MSRVSSSNQNNLHRTQIKAEYAFRFGIHYLTRQVIRLWMIFLYVVVSSIGPTQPVTADSESCHNLSDPSCAFTSTAVPVKDRCYPQATILLPVVTKIDTLSLNPLQKRL